MLEAKHRMLALDMEEQQRAPDWDSALTTTSAMRCFGSSSPPVIRFCRGRLAALALRTSAA
jgi:hypothetical protein